MLFFERNLSAKCFYLYHALMLQLPPRTHPPMGGTCGFWSLLHIARWALVWCLLDISPYCDCRLSRCPLSRLVCVLAKLLV